MRVLRLTLPALALLVAAEVAAAPVASNNRPRFCRGEASSKFGVRPIHIRIAKPVRLRNGAMRIDGRTDRGRQGTVRFSCRFDRRGNFIDVTAVAR